MLWIFNWNFILVDGLTFSKFLALNVHTTSTQPDHLSAGGHDEYQRKLWHKEHTAVH